MAAPVLTSAVVSGTTVTLTFDTALDSSVTLDTADFTVNSGFGSGGNFSVLSAQVDPINTSTVVLTLNTSLGSGQAATLSYNDPTTGDDPNVIQSAADPTQDAADFSVTLRNNTPDTNAPSVAISASDTHLASGETATLTFTFSEAPTGFTASDVVVSNGTVSDFQATSDPRIYTATLTPAEEGAVSASVTAQSYTDAAGNPGAGATENLTADFTAPTVSVALAASTVSFEGSTTVTFTFSEAPHDFTAADVTASNGSTITDFSATADPLVYTATVATTSLGHTIVSVTDHSYTDLAGNPGASGEADLLASSQPPPSPPPVVNPDTDDIIYATLGGTTMLSGSGGDDHLYGADGADTLQGNTGADTVEGGAGDDVLLGGQGDDFVQGNTGNDLIFGDIGSDTLHGGQGDDVLQGGVGNDVVSGDLGDDRLHGGKGDDLLFGGDGNDTLQGDLGNDTLTGGAGADHFYFAEGTDGHDVITDFTSADGDKIVLDATFATDFATVTSHLSADASGNAVLDFGSEVITLTGVAPASLTASDFLFV